MSSATILITGCSSGIGHATAEYAAARGHRVIASAPSDALLGECPDSAAARYVLDVCDEASIDAAVSAAEKEVGPIDVLVNNAGYCQAGPVELVPAEGVEKQFRVNVFGTLAMIRRVLPAMRERRSGTIVNLASLFGLMGGPFLGIYVASKHAIEGLSDCLRMEVADFGVRVVIIEPGWIRSKLTETSIEHADPSWQHAPSPYAARLQSADAKKDQAGAIEGEPLEVAREILRAIESSSPRARYKVTPFAKAMPVANTLLPAGWMDRILLKTFT
jgi:NAD(P)-dependent dehydrogenase (short-subunit alcohol dehydrogenase family)